MDEEEIELISADILDNVGVIDSDDEFDLNY